MSKIREELRFMNELEIILNLKEKETQEEFKKLSKKEQRIFIERAKAHLVEINQKVNSFFDNN